VAPAGRIEADGLTHLRRRRSEGPLARTLPNAPADGPAQLVHAPLGTTGDRDFLADEVELAEAAETVVRALRAQKGDDWIQQGDINSLEKLVLHCRSVDQSDAAASAAEIWKAFKLWKIELAAAMATRTVKEDSCPRTCRCLRERGGRLYGDLTPSEARRTSEPSAI
jgi:hypothetical protein